MPRSHLQPRRRTLHCRRHAHTRACRRRQATHYACIHTTCTHIKEAPLKGKQGSRQVRSALAAHLRLPRHASPCSNDGASLMRGRLIGLFTNRAMRSVPYWPTCRSATVQRRHGLCGREAPPPTAYAPSDSRSSTRVVHTAGGGWSQPCSWGCGNDTQPLTAPAGRPP